MDRFTDGGMAPALQSSSHQSAGLPSTQVEASQTESALFHDKVNGSTCKVDSVVEDNLTESSAKEATIYQDSRGQVIASDSSIDQDHKLDSCLSSELGKGGSEVAMPALHIGQGDSAMGHITDYNGWGDRKKSFVGGILQESSNLSDVRPNNKSSLSIKSMLKNAHSDTNIELTCNGAGKNILPEVSSTEYNGHCEDADIVRNLTRKIDQEPDSEVLCNSEDRAPSLEVESLLSVGKASESLHDHPGAQKDKHTPSVPIEVKCEENIFQQSRLPVSVDCTSESCIQEVSSPTQCIKLPGANIDPPNVTDAGTEESAPTMFLYSPILPDDLSGMNMSDNLTNTLQELAASLKESSFPIQLDVASKIISSAPENTVNTDGNNVSALNRSAKSLDFSREEDSFERETRISSRIADATNYAGELDRRLSFLRQKFLTYRSNYVKQYTRNQLRSIARCLPGRDWESQTVNVVDADSTSPVDLWQKILEDGPDSPTKAGLNHFDGHDRLKIETSFVEPVDKLGNDRRSLLDLASNNIDPTIHPAQQSSGKTSSEKFCKVARRNAGVLKKELRHATSCCDPDLTESSSDEDFEAAYEQQSRKTKSSSKANTKPRITRYRKSFCRWVTERAEISRKWAWLQSRIASMEFQIRSQGDLYNQLRTNKGGVCLVHSAAEDVPDIQSQSSNKDDIPAHTDVTEVHALAHSSSPPCSINHVLDNVNHQASRLMDKLSPVSGGWPSPVQEEKTSENATSVIDEQCTESVVRHGTQSLDVEEACARTIALDRRTFKTRKLVRINQRSSDPKIAVKPATVPNDSSIMCCEQRRPGLRQTEDYSSLKLKAAAHDHSYHATLSSPKDIPLSVSIRAAMKSKHNWSKNQKKKDKAKKESKREKKKKPDKKLHRSLQVNHLEETVERKRRKLTSQLSESSTRKRASCSIDCDMDSQVLISGISSSQLTTGLASGASTPTSEMFASNQIPLKKKKAVEQTFDIDNVVIPLRLNTSRIEKLVYKEIQTPSWRQLEILGLDQETLVKDETSDDFLENTADFVFQKRHEDYEICEKKKFMLSVQSRKSRRGGRPSHTRESVVVQEPTSPVAGESEASQPTDPLTNVPTSQIVSSMNPTVKPDPTRRLSGDINTKELRATSPHALPLSQRNFDTSYTASSPIPSCHSEAGSRRNSHENASHVSRTLSCSVNKTDDTSYDGWELRSFPLTDEDMKTVNDVEYARTLLKVSGHNGTMYRNLDVEDPNRLLNPRGHTLEKTHDILKLGALDVFRDPAKLVGRRRTDSRASSVASFDDFSRHSDASTTSQRKKKGLRASPEASNHGRASHNGKGCRKTVSRRSKHEYLHFRLSETDDTSTDSDMDSTDDGLSSTSGDAGHLIDDYADPEWEAPRHRDRR